MSRNSQGRAHGRSNRGNGDHGTPLTPTAPPESALSSSPTRCHQQLVLEKEVPTPGRITSVKLAANKIIGKRSRREFCVYVQTTGNPSVTQYTTSGTILTTFGTGSGGLLIDPARDCVCLADGGTVSRVSRDGTATQLGSRYLPIEGEHKVVSMAMLVKGANVRYAAVDLHLNRVIIIDPNTGDVTKKVKVKDGKFKIRHIATRPGQRDSFAVTGLHSNQIRRFNADKWKKWKMTELIGCQGNGHDQLRNPAGMCMDAQGRIIVCDHGNARVVRFIKVTKDMWRCDVIVSPEVLGWRRPSHVDVSTDGHVIVSVQSQDSGRQSWLLFTGYN